MLAKQYRLTKRNDFQAIFKFGRKGFSKFFSIRFLPNKLENSRVAIVASGKTSKKAVERNHLKRQISPMISDFLPKFKNNFDVIIYILSPALGKNYQVLQEELENTLKKSRII